MQNVEIEEQELRTKPQIQFLSGFEETTVPRRINLTKSENGQTGTATFLFFKPTIFSFFLNLTSPQITGMDLIWDKKKIRTQDIKIYFQEGKPHLVRSIFIFRSSKDWFNFLNFMQNYSKETGLSFTEFKIN